MNTALKEAKEKQIVYENKKNEASAQVEIIKNKLPADFYNYIFASDREKKEYYNKQSQEIQKNR